MNVTSNDSYGLFTKETATVPLEGVEVFSDIVGRSARVKIVQKFTNKENKPVEAVYKFPLPESAAICGFKAKVGDKIIKGEIEEREQAFTRYDDALIDGHGAYLLDQERPNIFTLSVGNLNPGMSVIIEIEYITQLEAYSSDVRFFLPTTISPRYIPAKMPDKEGIPIDEIINPDISLDVPYGMALNLNIHDKNNIISIGSPSHAIQTKIDSDPISVKFTSDTVQMDRDFVLNIKYRDGFEIQGYAWQGELGAFVQIDFSPIQKHSASSDFNTKNEVVFLLDCSGSMDGDSITQAKKAIEIAIRSLSEGTRFNIYRFGSTFEKLFSSSLPYNNKTAAEALDYILRIDADLGGTEILAPLEDIYNNELTDGHIRNIIVITDGQIGNEDAITELSKNGKLNNRLFTVGIGYGPNEYFIRQLARISKGASELIAPGESIETKVLRLFKKVSSSSIDNLKIHWPERTEQSPALPAVYYGENISIFGRMPENTNIPDEITITAGDDATIEWKANVHKIENKETPISLMWARGTIGDLEASAFESSQRGSNQIQRKENGIKEKIIGLSKEFGIVSSKTSFVAVELREENEKTKEESVLRKVPVMLTAGWGGKGIHVSQQIAVRSISFHSIAREDSIQKCRSTAPFRGVRKSMRLYDARPPYEDSIQKAERAIPDNLNFDLSDPYDVVIKILELQRPEGGFDIVKELVEKVFNRPTSEFKDISSSIDAKKRPNKLVLLATAIIIALLKKKYMDQRDIWSGMINKSEEWLAKEIEKTQPSIDNIPLKKWVEDFVDKI